MLGALTLANGRMMFSSLRDNNMVAKAARRSHRVLGYTGVALLGFVLISSVLVWGSDERKGVKRMGWVTGDLRWWLRKRGSWFLRKSNANPIEITGKGLPAYGLTVIGFSDPQFSELMSDYFGDDPPELIKVAAPTSVFLINESNKALVAYDLTYDFRAADGEVSSNDFSPIFVPALMDLPQSRLAEDQALVILPGRGRLISPLLGSGGLSKGQVLPSFGNESAEKRQKEQMMSAIKSTLAWTSSVTITLDGAFFENGSFVGPNTSGFFEKTKAIIVAQRDLLEWLVEANRKRERKGDGSDIVFSELEAKVKEMPRPTSQGSPADFYKNEQLEVAQEILRMRDKIGAGKVILEKTKVLEAKWPVLHKLGDGLDRGDNLPRKKP
jgi:hypothetical protein